MAKPVVMTGIQPGQVGQVVTRAMFQTFAMIGQFVVPILCLAAAAVSVAKRQRRSKLVADVAQSRAPDALDGVLSENGSQSTLSPARGRGSLPQVPTILGMHRHSLRVAWAWIASIAVLLMSLAPSVSEAIENARGGAPVEICSMGGLMRVTPHPDHPDGSGHLLQHCPYCALHAHALAPPPAPITAWARVVLPRDMPVLFLQAAHTAHAWVSARLRGPPAAA